MIFISFSTLLLISVTLEDRFLAAWGLNANCHGHSIFYTLFTILLRTAEILFWVMLEHFWEEEKKTRSVFTKKVTPFKRMQKDAKTLKTNRFGLITSCVRNENYLTQSNDTLTRRSVYFSNATTMLYSKLEGRGFQMSPSCINSQ